MEDNKNADESPITLIPDEVILLIIMCNEVPDLVNLSSTCKRFRDLILNNNFIWRRKFVQTLGEESQRNMFKNKDDINWLHELKGFYEIKKCVISELVSLSPKFWNNTEVLWEDIGSIFKISIKSELSFYYTIFVLQDIIRKTNWLIETNCSKPIYSLTTTYYAKIVLGHLMQTFLCIKWVEAGARDALTPEVVTTFFVQWVNPDKVYSDEKVDKKIQDLVTQVKDLLKVKGKCTDTEIIKTISEVIYRREQITLLQETNLKTINIIEVLRNKQGSKIALGAIYQTVAKRLGLECELCAFSNHFFLEWECKDNGVSRKFTIDLHRGEFKPKRQCPYTLGVTSKIRYTPMDFLEYIYTVFVHSVPPGLPRLQDWECRNVNALRDFLTALDPNPYQTYLQNVNECIIGSPEAWDTTIDMKWMIEKYLVLISGAPNMKKSQRTYSNHNGVKKRTSDLKYAVGMVCYHVQYYYMCVIRGWEVDEGRKPCLNEPYDGSEPVYNIISEDSREKNVPQGRIKSLSQPRRVRFAEDLLGRDFTHFDGFVYVPNNERMLEYPDELSVINYYKNDCVSKQIK